MVAQRVVHRDNLPIATHAAIFSGEYCLIHALTSGVEETAYVELISDERKFRIVRYKPLRKYLEEEAVNYGHYWMALTEFSGNKYNWFFKIGAPRYKQFCSQLVADALLNLGFVAFPMPHKVTPTEIDRTSRNDTENWSDVTDEVTSRLQELNVYKMYHAGHMHQYATEGLKEAKKFIYEERLSFHFAFGHDKPIQRGMTGAETAKGRSIFADTKERIDEYAKKLDPKPGLFFKAFAILLTEDQGLKRFFSTLQLPGER